MPQARPDRVAPSRRSRRARKAWVLAAAGAAAAGGGLWRPPAVVRAADGPAATPAAAAAPGPVAALGPVAGSGADRRPVPDRVDYNRDVRPILSDTCFKCHGFDPATRKAKLRLDTPEGAAAGGGGGDGPAIVPGKPDESPAFRRLVSHDPDELMPPAKSGLVLTPRQVAVVRRWIEQGAAYQPHWAFVPPIRPELPAVRDAGWAKNPVDRFVLGRLEEEKLTPSAEAGRATLIRRASLDLTGLPPTPAEVDAFLADRSADAYEKVVDRLLASPHYGERMAQPSLDAARYADTSGYQADWERHLWPYRDWVVRAFNDNLPFDRFAVEQLAGDMLPGDSSATAGTDTAARTGTAAGGPPCPTVAQRVASGFNRNHRVNDEGGIIPEEYAVEYVVDRVETTSAVFLGLTAGCARCHDHKYDPVTQRDFYRLFAYFDNVPEKGQDGRAGFATPMMRVPPPDKVTEVESLERQAVGVERRLAEAAAAAGDRLAAWDAAGRKATGGGGETSVGKAASVAGGWVPQRPVRASGSGGPDLHLLPDGSVRAMNVSPPVESTYTVVLRPDVPRATGLRVDLLTDPTQPGRYLGRGDGNVFLTDVEVTLTRPGGKPTPVKLRAGGADYAQAGRPAAAAVDGDPATGWAVDGDLVPGPHAIAFVFDAPVDLAGSGKAVAGGKAGADAGATLTVRLKQGTKAVPQQTICRLRLSLTADPTPDLSPAGLLPETVAAALRVDPAARSADQASEVADSFAVVDPTLRSLRDEAVRLRRAAADLAAGGPPTMVMREMPRRRPTYLLKRGQYDQPDTSVALTPGLPAALTSAATFAAASASASAAGGAAAPPPTPAEPKDRLELARWLVSPANPLTARVTVNRLWQQFFGTGIVKTSEDFGLQGEWPSHPELLDWLAVEFRQPADPKATPWDVKRFVRLIVTSAAYRQASAVTPALLERDPDNRLLARGPRLRLDAQAVRDNALAAAGLLVPTVGGPPVKPYQPAGLWEELAFSNKTSLDSYVQDKGEKLYRRSLYTFFKRTVPPPGLALFDAAGREACTVRLPRTNTPLQALTLLNDVTYVEAARVMAARVMREGGREQADRLAYAFRLATARRPDAREATALAAAFDRYLAAYRADPAAAAKLVAVGEAPKAQGLDVAEHAAYAAVCNVILNLDETVTKE